MCRHVPKFDQSQRWRVIGRRGREPPGQLEYYLSPCLLTFTSSVTIATHWHTITWQPYTSIFVDSLCLTQPGRVRHVNLQLYFTFTFEELCYLQTESNSYSCQQCKQPVNIINKNSHLHLNKQAPSSSCPSLQLSLSSFFKPSKFSSQCQYLLNGATVLSR